MEFIAYGADYGHKTGEFCPRATLPYYFLSHFRTDYVAEIDGALVRGAAGDCMLLEPGQIIYHGPLPHAKEGFRNDWMYVKGEAFRALLERYPLPCGTPFRIDGAPPLSATIEGIHKEKSLAREGFADVCDLLMTRAVIDMYRALRRGDHEASDALAYVRREILRSFERAWSLDDMAHLSGYSKPHFCALYKQRFGISPVNDLLNYRIEQAKSLLLYGNMSLGELAHATGFTSLYYFSKYFKKKEGVPPSEYPKQRLP